MASRSAAAEARRQRILERGADRLSSISIGGKKEPTEATRGTFSVRIQLDQQGRSSWDRPCAGPDNRHVRCNRFYWDCAGKPEAGVGSSTGHSSSVPPDASKAQQEQQAPSQDALPIAQPVADAGNLAKKASTRPCRDEGAATPFTGADEKDSGAQQSTARPQGRAERWAEYEGPSSSTPVAAAHHVRPHAERFAFLQVQHPDHPVDTDRLVVVVCSCAFSLISTKSTNHWFLQALQSASEATHLYRLMLALVLPVLSRSMMWNHAIGALTPSIRSAPLVQLVLLQLFLLQAALLAAMIGLGPMKKDAKVRKICHH